MTRDQKKETAPNPVTLIEVSRQTGIELKVITVWIEREWIRPQAQEAFDHEDIARARLIRELLFDFGANEEAVPLILHLMDQLYHFRNKLRVAGLDEGLD